MSAQSDSQESQQQIFSNVNARDINTGNIYQVLISIIQGDLPPKPKIILEWLHQNFERARNSWLSNRYSPDIHQTGQIEADLQLRLNGISSQYTWLEETREIRILLEDLHLAILRLRRYPQFMQRDDAENLIKSAEEWITVAITEQQEIESRILSKSSLPLPDFEMEATHDDAPWTLITILCPQKEHSSELPTADIGKQLETTLNRWLSRNITPKYLQFLGQPVAYIGEPGVGKTHAIAYTVGQQIEAGKPAILIRAKDVDLSQSWEFILADAIGLPKTNINQLLGLLESTASQIEASVTADGLNNSNFQPIRVLIAIDGLDETPKAERWVEKLGELIPLLKQYPKILFVCSLRSSFFYRINFTSGISSVHLNGSDATLDKIFESYCNVNRIKCPPILRWALRTPLAIRLFADLYKGQHIHTVTLENFSLVNLIKQKIDYAERAIRESNLEGWSENLTPVHDTLSAIVKACLSKGELLQSEVLQVAETGQRTPGILSRQQLLYILDNCLNHGLLLLRRQSSEDPLEGDLLFWEPAYESITDFLLAWEAHKQAKINLHNPEMPSYLKYRGDAITLAAYLLGMKGYDFFTTGLWSNNLSTEKREELRLITILMMPPDKGENYRNWVIEIFTRNMPSCRIVLEKLVIPGLRIPGHLYGSKFVHEVLLPMQVAERDLFWSGPDYIPYNHGASWEGFGKPVLDNLEIADDDSWDTAPLLLAWATTTVKNNTRRQIRGKIAVWGSKNPDGLFALLKKTCQTNDPQMKEDIFSAAYGASCLIRPDEKWLPLCNWLIINFCVPKALLYTYNIIVRHSIRSIIERCVACQVAIDVNYLAAVRISYIDAEEILDINKNAAINVNPHWGIEPATKDLAWYVVPRVIKPFFDEYRLAQRNQARKHFSEEEADDFEDIDANLLNKFIEGSLRKSASMEARKQVEEFLKAKAEVQRVVEIFQAATDEEKEELLVLCGISQDKETENEEISETLDESSKKPEYSPSAQAILAQYAEKYALPNLKPIQLTFGFVSAYSAKLGWFKDVFIKEPNGGEPGEILGADIAILRQYPQASHGSRSTTATFGEKYVWAATNELSGFLANQVAIYDWNKYFEPPVDLSLLAEPTNPASDIGYGRLKLNQILKFSELVPDTELSNFNQVDRANEWVQKAPLPNIQSLLFQNSDQLPEWAKNDEWVVLRSFVIRRNADSQAESVLRASSFLCASNGLSLIEEDTQFGTFPNFYDLYQFSSGVESVETYRDPCEVVWAPWIQEIEGIIRYKTLNILGYPTELQLQATTCQFHWETPDGENEEWVLAKTLREMLEIVDFREGQFLTASGQVQAFTFDNSGERWHTPSGQILLVRRTALFEALTSCNLSIGWGIWLNREPAYPLITISGKKRMFRNWYAIAFYNSNTFKVIPYKDEIEPWYKDEV
jgi:hypothetical protein